MMIYFSVSDTSAVLVQLPQTDFITNGTLFFKTQQQQGSVSETFCGTRSAASVSLIL